MRSLYPVVVLALLFVPAPAHSSTLTGRVVRVSDGDTLVILRPGNSQSGVRLSGIAAPEINQPYGRQSRDNLTGLVAGKFVVVDDTRRDPSGRIEGKVLLGNQDMNLEQIQTGLAWYDPSAASVLSETDRELYAAAEAEARAAGRGLWADPHPVPPWEWRILERKK
jgi:endonuclease YncB( thermonuclease family)